MSEIKIDPEQLKKLADVYQQAEDEAENTLKELKWDTPELMLTLTLSSTGRIRDLQSELNHSIETYRQKVDETQEAVMIARAAIQSADRSMAEHFGVFALELVSYYDIQRINPENEFDPITGEKLSDFDRDLALLMLVLTLAPPAKALGIAAKMGIKGVKTYLVREGAYLIRSAKNVMNPKVLKEMGKRAFTATKKGPIAKTAQGVKDHITDMKKIGHTLRYLGGNVEDLLVLEKVGPDIIEETAKNKSAKEIMEMIKDKALSNIEKAKETLVRFGGKGNSAPYYGKNSVPKGPYREVNGYPVKVKPGAQEKHIPNTPNYKQEIANGKNKSIFYGNNKKAQELLDKFAGKGELLKNGRERVDFGEPIGKYYDRNTGEYLETTKGLIHYGKDGAHIVPSRP
ncbi:polymorphic toxin type 50 domain-containing protein [Rossellomorea marisflavi]|uniref:polymorphic toxin type 50 domain-containing protein n=1 Tax=Rossellomorea marisflavi TaxID=189381 RepID=UPI003458A0C8